MSKPLSAQNGSAQIDRQQNKLQAQPTMPAQPKAHYAESQRLVHNEGRQRVKTVHAALFSIDLSYRLISTSPNFQTYTDLLSEQTEGRSLIDFIHTDDTQLFMERCRYSTPKRSQTLQLRIGTMKRGYRWMRITVTPLIKGNKCVGLKGVLFDIDTAKQARDTSAFEANKYRDIIENLQEGYFETDLWGRITVCNKALLTLSGYGRSELIGKTYRDVTSLHMARAMQVQCGKVYKSGQNAKRFSHEVFHKLGHTLRVEYSVSLIENPYGNPSGFRGILRDITEQAKTLEKQQRLQEQLNQSRKMNALGTLAGGLAHGFNNVLMAIQGNLSLMRMNLSQEHPLQKNIDRINQAAEKGNCLAREILSFAKIGKFVVMPTNLNKIIQSTCRMFVRAHPNLKVHERLCETLWRTQVDRVQIGQALLSLYLNAVEAMPQGGDLYLRSENVVLDEADTGPLEAKPGRYVKISVIDSGIGLEDKAKERIFEPFFCAYRPLRYEDLGLATAYGTIKKHQGIINVYSKKGEGATFTLYLPAIPRQKATNLHPDEKAAKVETVLLVDDEALCAQAGREILERQGYRVMIANNGQEAIELYATYQNQINVVLLDVILPDIDGDIVFQELKKRNPEATVIVVSGYNVNQQVSTLLNQGCVDFIQKPFLNETLSNKVRAALDRVAVPPAVAHLIS